VYVLLCEKGAGRQAGHQQARQGPSKSRHKLVKVQVKTQDSSRSSRCNQWNKRKGAA